MASTIFSGNSRFASDFSQIIDRSLQIAALPKTQLVNQKATLGSQQDAWNALQTRFSSLRQTLTSLTNAVGSSGVTAVSSDSSIARPTTTTGVLQGTYSVEVSNIGAKSTALGLGGVASPSTHSLASATEFSLTANGVTKVITPAANNLSSLVDAINQNTAAGVSATLVNVASAGATPSYRLSLQSTKYNSDPITLSYDDGTVHQLLDTSATGASVEYRINGYPAPADPALTSDSRTLTVSVGLQIQAGKTGTADITVSRSATTLTTAISNLVTAYNTTVDEVDKSRGRSAGVLKGQSSISLLSNSLRSMMSYTGSGDVSSIEGLGIQFGSDGRLTFDSTVITGMSTNELASATAFLGNGTSNGLLKAASTALGDADSATYGVVSSELSQLTSQISDKQKAIDESQRRLDDLQASLAARMSAADALIASLEQQVNYYTGMFEAMRANSRSN